MLEAVEVENVVKGLRYYSKWETRGGSREEMMEETREDTKEETSG